jgi:histidyl-tRNA synthetase
MQRFFIVLAVCALLVFSIQLQSAIKNECCPTHFQILKAYQEFMQSLVEKVKAETADEFEKRYHDKEALSYLGLIQTSLEEVAAHYKELTAAEDEATTRAVLARVENYVKQLKGLRPAEAKKLVESIDVRL